MIQNDSNSLRITITRDKTFYLSKKLYNCNQKGHQKQNKPPQNHLIIKTTHTCYEVKSIFHREFYDDQTIIHEYYFTVWGQRVI